jgi:NADH-quinone oxidoreductase subunit N
VEFQEFVSYLIVNTKGNTPGADDLLSADSSLRLFMPEIILCVTIVAMLFVRLFDISEKVDRAIGRFLGGGLAFVIALVGSLLAFVVSCEILTKPPLDGQPLEIFTGMLVFDTFGAFIRAILMLFAALFIFFTCLTGIPDREDGPDIYTLVLGSTLGMCLMASANHLLMVFMAIEMASVPSYALSGMLKGRRLSSEAALKYSVYGAGAAGVMLYGISLVAGLLNTAHLPTIALQLADRINDAPTEELMVLAMGGLMIMTGLAFKLSAVPFHFWCPDVFEGASAEVAAFLSVASKAAALALLVRVALGVGLVAPDRAEPGQQLVSAEIRQSALADDVPAAAGIESATPVALYDSPAGEAAPEEATEDAHPAPLSRAEANENLAPARNFIGKMIALFAILTCTFGNLAAYGQTNIKRLLAYSTIAHAGYMMMAVPPVLALAASDVTAAQSAGASLLIYISIYLFMNLGAFAVVAFLRNEMRSEEIADYGGLIRRCPGLVIMFAMMLFSLIGLPPLAGFIGKFAVFAALANGFQGTGQTYLLVLLFVGSINTAISLFYYLRVVKVMTMDDEPESRTPFSIPFAQGMFVVALAVPTAFLLFGWQWLSALALQATSHLFS